MRRLCFEGRPDAALALGYEAGVAALAAAAAEPDPGGPAHGTVAQIGLATVFALVDAGRVHPAEAIARTGHDEAVRQGAGLAQGWFAAARAATSMLAGRVLDARRWATEGRLLGRLHHDGRLHAISTEALLMSYGLLGEPAPMLVAPAVPTSVRGVDEDQLTALGLPAGLDLDVRRRAWGGTGRERAAALDALASASAAAATQGLFGLATAFAGEVALLGDAPRARQLLADLGPVDGDLYPLWPVIVDAAVDGDAATLARCADRLEELGVMGVASVLTVHAAGLELESAPERARELMRAANRRAHGVQHGEAYLAQFRRMLPLREREREIAELAASGLTNKQIAEHLVISIRTVENHLYRVYEKLGIEGRTALVDLFSGPIQPR